MKEIAISWGICLILVVIGNYIKFVFEQNDRDILYTIERIAFDIWVWGWIIALVSWFIFDSNIGGFIWIMSSIILVVIELISDIFK